MKFSSTKPPRRKIAYVLGEFPSISETFILNEVKEVKKHHIAIDIFALTKKQEVVSQKEALRLLSQVSFPPKKIDLIIENKESYLEPNGINRFIFWSPLVNLYALFKAKNLFLNHFFLAMWLAKKIKQQKISHIHAHFPEPSLVAFITSLLTGTSFSFTVHSHLEREKKYWLTQKVKHAKFVTAVGNSIKKEIINVSGGKYSKKINVIYSGINTQHFQWIKKHQPATKTINKKSFQLVSIGRLVEHKGFRYLLKAMSSINKKYSNIKLVIIGDGPQKKLLKSLCRKFSLEEKVIFTGPLPHGKNFFNHLLNSDAFILPCVTDKSGNQDGLPVAILEAMALQLPVISTKVASISEAVNSSCGILVQSKNSSELARAIKSLHNASLKQKQTMGKNGQKQVIRKFNLQKNTQRLAGLLK